MRTYISLALRRERLLLIGLAACFILSLPFGALLMKLGHETALRGYHAALALWTLVGLPGMAVLFGASAGATLRHDPDKGAEEPMPLSPRQRAAAACAAAALQVALLSLLVAAVGCATSGSWREMFLSNELYFKWQGYPYVRLPIWFLAGTEAVVLLWSFLWAYLFGNGVLGGMLGFLWGAMPFVALAFAFRMKHDFGALAAVWPWGIAACAAVLAGPPLCMSELPPRLERRSFGDLRGVLVILLGCVMGTAAAGAHLAVCWRSVNRSFVHYLFGHGALNAFRGPARDGLLLGSRRGDLLLLRPDGTRELLLQGEDYPLAHLINEPWHGRLDSEIWGEDGTLWVLKEADGGREIWRRAPGKKMVRHTSFPETGSLDFVRHGKELGLRGWHRFAPIPAEGKAPQWVKFEGYEALQAFLKDRPRLDPKDRRVLRKGRMKWELPGEKVESSLQESPAGLFVSVELGKERWSVVLCTPEGKTRTMWERPYSRVEALPDGTLWSWRDWRHLFLLTPDGKMHESLAMDRTLSMASLVRVDGASLWFLGDMLFKADIKTGTIQERRTLPKRNVRESDCHSHKDGLYLSSGAKLWFVGWDGATRTLDTSPSLPGPS